MPSLPDLPGKSLVTETTKRARVLAVGAGFGAVGLAAGALKKVLGHRDEERIDADPIAEGRAAPPGAEEKPVPPAGPVDPVAEPDPGLPGAIPYTADDEAAPSEVAPGPVIDQAIPKTEKPKAPKRKRAKAKPKAKAAAKPKAGKPKPKPAKAKPKAKAKPPKAKKAAPKPPKDEPGNISVDRDHPHRALSNPVGDPDETEYPDPFEKRSDPRDPPDPDGKPFGEEPHPQTGSESTSEPRPAQDLEAPRGGKPPKRENLND